MPRHMYEVSAEVEPMAGVDFPEEAEGAFVSCFVPAERLVDSLSAAESFLESNGFRVIDLDYALRIDLREYQPDDADHPTADAISQALSSGEILSGPFLLYVSRDEE